MNQLIDLRISDLFKMVGKKLTSFNAKKYFYFWLKIVGEKKKMNEWKIEQKLIHFKLQTFCDMIFDSVIIDRVHINK